MIGFLVGFGVFWLLFWSLVGAYGHISGSDTKAGLGIMGAAISVIFLISVAVGALVS